MLYKPRSDRCEADLQLQTKHSGNLHQGAAGVFAVCNKNFLEHSNERRQKENSQLSEASPFEPTSKPREHGRQQEGEEKGRGSLINE